MTSRGDKVHFASDSESSEDARLVLSDNGLVTGEKKKHKYGEEKPRCGPGNLTRNEWICVGVGVAGIVGVVILFVVIGVGVAAVSSSENSGSSSPPWEENVRLPSSVLPEGKFDEFLSSVHLCSIHAYTHTCTLTHTLTHSHTHTRTHTHTHAPIHTHTSSAAFAL